MSTSRHKMVIALSLIAAAIGVGALVRFRIDRVGGIPSSYAARDHDPRLAREAATAQPLIASITRHRTEHGQFPTNFLALGLPFRDWWYEGLPSGYILSKKLGMDTALLYRFEHGNGRWFFDPGDGSNPEREIKL